MAEVSHYVYPYSCVEAKRLDQLAQWRESHKENIACKNAIEEAIRRDFDGMHLDTVCAEKIIGEYGSKRVNWVLANTVQQKEWDGRFSHDNKDWAKRIYIPPDEDNFTGYSRNLDFIDFIGILQETYLPEWAREKLMELQIQSARDSPHLGGMEIK